MNANRFILFSLLVSTLCAALIVFFMPSLYAAYVVGTPALVPIATFSSVTISNNETVATTTVAVVLPPPVPPKKPFQVKPIPPKYIPPVYLPPLSATTTEPVATTTQIMTIGTTTLAVGRIPLLMGGTVRSGQTVAVSYLQITNIGNYGAQLKGFWVRQTGSAPVESILGLSTVDDKGGSRGTTGGSLATTTLFQNGAAFAPTDAYFAPGQMRLFTIKAIMGLNSAPLAGMEVILEVTSLETTASVRGAFPIHGTTWTIGE